MIVIADGLVKVMRCEVKFGAMALLSKLVLVTNAFALGIATKKVHKNKMATEMNLAGKKRLTNFIGSLECHIGVVG